MKIRVDKSGPGAEFWGVAVWLWNTTLSRTEWLEDFEINERTFTQETWDKRIGNPRQIFDRLLISDQPTKVSQVQIGSPCQINLTSDLC